MWNPKLLIQQRDGDANVFTLRLAKENQDWFLREVGLLPSNEERETHVRIMTSFANDFVRWCAHQVRHALKHK